eukprot:14187966-Alexandrium_andersonii.AAC.1
MSASLVGSEMCIRDRFLGPRSSRFERLKQFCILLVADCGLRRLGALRSFGQIADCTLGTLRCKGASKKESRVQTALGLGSAEFEHIQISRSFVRQETCFKRSKLEACGPSTGFSIAAKSLAGCVPPCCSRACRPCRGSGPVTRRRCSRK